MLLYSLYHVFKIINVSFWRAYPIFRLRRGSKMTQNIIFWPFWAILPPLHSWNIPYSDKNDRSYVRKPWYLVEKGVDGVRKGFERKKIDLFHFWAIFLYILSENSYILKSQFPTISSFQKNLKKFWKFFLMEWNLGRPLLEQFGKIMFFWDTLF